MSVEIEASDVIKLILQFLKENNLKNTLTALQDETDVVFNSVEDINKFQNDILSGNWEQVVNQLNEITFPEKKRIDLYQQIFFELLEDEEVGTAKALLRQTEPFMIMKETDPDNYMELESMLNKPFDRPFSRDKERRETATKLIKEMSIVQPSRLMSIIGDSLKWQNYKGHISSESTYDIFNGAVSSTTSIQDDAPPSYSYTKIKLAKNSYAECGIFSPDGQYFVTGTVDGFVEVWNYITGKLRTDLPYQSQNKLIVMEEAITSLAFSSNSEYLASGSRDGQVAVWKIQTGACYKRFPKAHSKGIACMLFIKDNSQLLTGSFDCSIRLHGFKSGKNLKEFRGHTSYVNSILSFDNLIVSGSSDGHIKFWDIKTCECLKSISPTTSSPPASVLSLQYSVKSKTQFFVCSKSTTIHLMDIQGNIIKKYSLNVDNAPYFNSCLISPKASFLYGLAENGSLYVFNLETNSIEKQVALSDRELVNFAHHPLSNIICTLCDTGAISFWKP